ncbi:DNA alkylation repair protein [Brevibacillus reuszeri]|uniref:DNA alkylation repair protein n=1 Tax=Brevibacillus reuszeri TaxID=54915 RepID=A0A0K9YXJ5_9BACL|nr:DNA alkylation repair protein [Brevibacillus reuszeri]KNB73444.1 DNA alkylation repair protein [Brevibacillus reuszeri]MED1858770.1 DNA alkylation repair protein [Brevibacillus reuszeri]GED69750.1 DNA alkylation repair protein [Brevibacillus reuszeri]
MTKKPVQKLQATLDEVLLRKGARKVEEIPEDVIKLLQKGQIQSVNLTEWLAIDHLQLLSVIVDELDLRKEVDPMLQRCSQWSETRIMKIIPAIASEWLQLLETFSTNDQQRIFHGLATHESDSVRCWAAYMIGLDPQLGLAEKLETMRPFAADAHFGVREISWMAVRESLSQEVMEAITFLAEWVQEEDPNIRRFAVEATRPRGVWAKHIPELKENPELGLPLLEAVKADSSRYVQDSVANWLNDASKTKPDWVQQVCAEWLERSNSKETIRIVTRAQRSLMKK